MLYSININQLALTKTQLDLIDGAIMCYLHAISSSNAEDINKNRINGFTWINFKHLISEMPLLKINNKCAISRRMKKIEKEGFINIMKQGNNLYIKLTALFDELFFNRCSKATVTVVSKQRIIKSDYNNNIYTEAYTKSTDVPEKLQKEKNKISKELTLKCGVKLSEEFSKENKDKMGEQYLKLSVEKDVADKG